MFQLRNAFLIESHVIKTIILNRNYTCSNNQLQTNCFLHDYLCMSRIGTYTHKE